MVSQHWYRKWLGAVRQQAITWANVDPDPCRQMTSLGLSELSIEKCQVVTFVTDKFEHNEAQPNCQPFADDFFKSIFLNENFLYFDYVFYPIDKNQWIS